MKKATLCLLFLLACVLPSLAQVPNSRESLRGLSAIPVQILTLQGQAYLADQIRNFIELRLRLAGIKVPSDNRQSYLDGDAMLFVTVVADPEEKKGSLLLEIELKQYVTLRRKSSIQTYVGTWSTRLIDPNATLSLDAIKTSVGENLDNFINDYLAVNPKR